MALVEGWRLRYDEEFRWSLLQPHRDRVFCKVRSFTVKEMTERGWLTRTRRLGLGSRPAISGGGVFIFGRWERAKPPWSG